MERIIVTWERVEDWLRDSCLRAAVRSVGEGPYKIYLVHSKMGVLDPEDIHFSIDVELCDDKQDDDEQGDEWQGF